MARHGPVEECSRRTTIPINERMDVCEPEVKKDRPYDRMDEPVIRRRLIGEFAHRGDAFFDLRGCGRYEQHVLLCIYNLNVLLGSTIPSQLLVVNRSFRQHLMEP